MFGLRPRILVPLSIMGLSTVVFGGGIWWLKSQSSQYLFRILERRQVLASYAQEIAELDVLRRQHSSVAQARQALLRAIPQRGELITLPARIAALGEGIGVSAAASFGAEEAGSEGKPSSIELLVFLSGEPRSLRQFLEELEGAAQPVVHIRGFDFSKAAEPRKLQGSLRTRVFFRP